MRERKAGRGRERQKEIKKKNEKSEPNFNQDRELDFQHCQILEPVSLDKHLKWNTCKILYEKNYQNTGTHTRINTYTLTDNTVHKTGPALE